VDEQSKGFKSRFFPRLSNGTVASRRATVSVYDTRLVNCPVLILLRIPPAVGSNRNPRCGVPRQIDIHIRQRKNSRIAVAIKCPARGIAIPETARSTFGLMFRIIESRVCCKCGQCMSSTANKRERTYRMKGLSRRFVRYPV